jgi:uncharacterized protein YecE (DUF72 family)
VRSPATAAVSCRLWVGTCGYSYPEWAEAGFYPQRVRPAQMLGLYARHFPITELNHTWYQMPRTEIIERQASRAPQGFLFSAKLVRSLSHEVDPGRWRDEVAAYRQGIAPLQRGGQLVAVLVQLPQRFHRTPANRSYLAGLLDELADLPKVVEFRHASWATDRVFDELERRKVGLAAVDTPPLPGLFPSLDVVTNPDLVYVRFHGRNSRGWYTGSKEQQFDYDYSDAELGEWVETRLERMARQARRAFVFFNNHVAAQAPKDAEALMEQLRRHGFRVAAPPNITHMGDASGLPFR